MESTLVEFGFGAHTGGARADLENVATNYAGDRAGFWVAEDDGVVVGTIAVRPRNEAVCELKRLYVSAAARGRGVGRMLYEHAEAFARAVGYEKIWLDSSRKFAAARRLYERNGFVLLDELANDWCDNVYEKSLRPGVRDLERLLLGLRRACETLLDFDMYDRWGAQHDTDAGRAQHAAEAARAQKDYDRLARELEDLVVRVRRDDAKIIATWVDAHVTYLRSLAFDADSTEASVRDRECTEWAAVARGEAPFVKENVFYVKMDPALYERAFGFSPA